MRKIVVALAGVLSLSLVAGPAAYGASKNVELLDNLPEVQNATAINFLEYGKERGRDDDDDDDRRGKASRRDHRRKSSDVMLVTGRFG